MRRWRAGRDSNPLPLPFAWQCASVCASAPIKISWWGGPAGHYRRRAVFSSSGEAGQTPALRWKRKRENQRSGPRWDAPFPPRGSEA